MTVGALSFLSRACRRLDTLEEGRAVGVVASSPAALLSVRGIPKRQRRPIKSASLASPASSYSAVVGPKMPYHWFDNPHDAVNRHVWGTRQSRRFFGSTGGFAVFGLPAAPLLEAFAAE